MCQVVGSRLKTRRTLAVTVRMRPGSSNREQWLILVIDDFPAKITTFFNGSGEKETLAFRKRGDCLHLFVFY